MDHLQKLAAQIRRRQIFLLLFSNSILVAGWWFGKEWSTLDELSLLWLLIAGAIFLSVILGIASAGALVKPFRLIWYAVMHVSPETANSPRPNLHKAHLGQELLTTLVGHIYRLSQVMNDVALAGNAKSHPLEHDFVANSLPLPLVVLDANQKILFANNAMATYLGRAQNDIVGQNMHTMLDLSFPNGDTLDIWLSRAKAEKAVDQHTWNRVRATVGEERKTKQFDLAAYYNQDNPHGFETMLALFDQTQQYQHDDDNLSFIALAVHELRTPVTLLRGYIEAFEEELSGKLTPELDDFMHKMKSSAQQLTIFINNILNVARIENDQLTLKLSAENWPNIINTAAQDMRLRAQVQNVELVVDIPQNLPTVGADNVSMYEVLNNLIDNAIKYSRPGGQVTIRTELTKDGLIETTVQDSGIGMPPNIVANLFEKFYRSHRSKSQVGGTGLGLYLCKALVEAHGGNIWVRSREGQGTTVGFTLKPFDMVDGEQKTSDNTDIVRRAHGWIKNHSLYRG